MVEPVPKALTVVEERARESRAADLARLDEVLGGTTGPEVEEGMVVGVRKHTRLTLNFHPDRRANDGLTVAEGLLQTGRYRPQNETGLSNGSRSAVPDGERTKWEHALFGDAYRSDQATRPVYGALDLTRDPHGGSPRFGSCFVELNSACFDRATFCLGDSHAGPTDVGTIACFSSVLAGLFEQGAEGAALDRSMTVEDLRAAIEIGTPADTAARCLDGYIEAQIHGGVALADDLAAICLDPSFRGTEIERNMTEAASQFGFELNWHGGSELPSAKTPTDFRGPEMPPLARRVARPDGIVDAAAIGRFASRIPFTQPTPTGDDPKSYVQQCKYLWHCLLRFGQDSDAQ